jgi:UDP-N-acetylmuramoyl-tripeptide--D-alanyl-D-alanine ligase
MGARYVGDIQELCELVTPGTAIVTNVGVAHTETMGDQESIALEKGTLVENVEPGGLAILNADDPRVNAMSSRNMVANFVRVGIDNTEADLVASDISYSIEGASFVVTDKETGASFPFKTQLLGRHNIMNILLAVAVGRSMDLRLRQMAHAVAQLEPVEHRLKLRNEGPILILDDAFNSNPVGAQNAVEILGQFKSGRRIVITPGMVELGEIQRDENEAFGRAMASNADLVLLIGPKQTAPILSGLLDAGFAPDRVHTFRALAEAQDFLKGFVRPGDVVLYENDLPDQYDEAA